MTDHNGKNHGTPVENHGTNHGTNPVNHWNHGNHGTPRACACVTHEAKRARAYPRAHVIVCRGCRGLSGNKALSRGWCRGFFERAVVACGKLQKFTTGKRFSV